MKIRTGIVGYGNLAKGVEAALAQNEDMELVAIFTRRNPLSIQAATKDVFVGTLEDAAGFKDKIDVLFLCGGSATDLPEQTPRFAADFHVVDSFDNHGEIPNHYKRVEKAALAGGKLAFISAGWDPGLFSLLRLYGASILPEGEGYTFWGKGVSQGHSDAVRRIAGVKNAKQYTIPRKEALLAVRSGENPELSTRQKHLRECFVVAEEGADPESIEKEIKEMPNYFADYDTTVHFISEETFLREHGGIPHGGFVIRSGITGQGKENKQLMEFSLKLDSNPEFTASVLVACARAVHRLSREGARGCRTLFDIPPAYLSPQSGESLRKEIL